MKLVLLLVAVGVLVWMLRSAARRDTVGRDRAAPTDPPKIMLRCAQCGLHLPSAEALPGRGGVFCGEAHRSAYEQAHPAP
jgi:uncharacterized protein